MKNAINNKFTHIPLMIMAMMTAGSATQAQAQTTEQGKYANVNGIKMYYEVHGTGKPLVLIHGGGSTLSTSFGLIIPILSKTHQIIAVELQAHGHTSDRDAPETFIQDADDVAELLRQLNITKTDVLGFSNGGQTTLEIALRHPKLVDRLIIASAFYSRDAVPVGFWEGFKNPKYSDMPQIYKDEYLKIGTQAGLTNMFNKDVQRMSVFKGWTKEQIASIQAPALVVIGDHDLTPPEHAAEMSRLLPHGQLAILPGAHGEYFGEAFFPNASSRKVESFSLIVEDFLASPIN
ncbi:alpha/beta fold hydrolase [Mucilaginibacter sp. NFX135]|uniref:alpha/beta fold hydrolase n=1 Tax=Mucilaginibacter sp. NFX135 TaxID=3402687 RepID=UPI003AFA6D02